MGRNIELEQQVERLEQERNELGLDEVARSLVRTARLAESGMAEAAADEGGPDVRYVIPRLDVSMRGVVGRRGDGFGIRFPGPEQGVLATALSTISMTVAQVPTQLRGHESESLQAGLEAAQATMSSWDRDKGRTAAGEIAAETTHLLSIRAQWPDSGDGGRPAGPGSRVRAIQQAGRRGVGAGGWPTVRRSIRSPIRPRAWTERPGRCLAGGPRGDRVSPPGPGGGGRPAELNRITRKSVDRRGSIHASSRAASWARRPTPTCGRRE